MLKRLVIGAAHRTSFSRTPQRDQRRCWSARTVFLRKRLAFANPDIYEFLEAEGMGYVIRLPANRVLQDRSDTC